MAYLIQILSLLSLLFYMVSGQDTSPSFNYTDTRAWGEIAPLCGCGRRQSPIDLDPDNFIWSKSYCPAVDFVSYDSKPQRISITNTGHTVQVKGNWPNSIRQPSIEVQSDVLMGSFRFSQFHLHWAETNRNGTEHRFNGHGLALELHVVHLNNKYRTDEDALAADDGILVYTRLFYADHGDGELDDLTKALGRIQTKGSEAALPKQALFKFGLNCPQKFITYQGSLTTPPCSENVNFLICAVPGSVSKKMMRSLRQVQLDHGDTNNVRPLQDPNDRPVYYFKCKT